MTRDEVRRVAELTAFLARSTTLYSVGELADDAMAMVALTDTYRRLAERQCTDPSFDVGSYDRPEYKLRRLINKYPGFQDPDFSRDPRGSSVRWYYGAPVNGQRREYRV